jgi:hypothetical protein
MAHGISQLENRDWDIKNSLRIKKNVRLATERYVLIESFERLPQLNADLAVSTNLNFELLGTNAANNDVTFSTTIAGIQLETNTTANDQDIIVPHLASAQSAWSNIKWGTENQVSWECVIRTGASVASIVIWAGLKLTNTSVVATDDDQAFFRFAAATDTYWNYIYSIGGTDTATASTVAVATSTTYNLRIEVDSSRKAAFYINDTLVGRSTALTNDVDLIPYIGVQTTTTAAKYLIVCKEQISRIWYE